MYKRLLDAPLCHLYNHHQMQSSLDYFKAGASVRLALPHGLSLVITCVSEDVSNAVLLGDDGLPLVPPPACYTCLNRTTDKLNAPYNNGWLLSWASTYSISHNQDRLVTIECQRMQHVRLGV